jgi:hypothetical protein
MEIITPGWGNGGGHQQCELDGIAGGGGLTNIPPLEWDCTNILHSKGTGEREQQSHKIPKNENSEQWGDLLLNRLKTANQN